MNLYLKRKKFQLIYFFVLPLNFVLIPMIPVIMQRGNCKDFFNSCESENRISNKKYFKIFDESTNKILKISDKEFLYAVVSCEMPANFENEALKAQKADMIANPEKYRKKIKKNDFFK